MVVFNFNSINTSHWFNFKEKIKDQTGNDDTYNDEIILSLKYLSNFGELLKRH